MRRSFLHILHVLKEISRSDIGMPLVGKAIRVHEMRYYPNFANWVVLL